jgi:SRSO17 transposase
VLEQDGHAAWSESFNELFAQVAGVFGNASLRRHGRWYVLGLLSHQERKNSWWLSEFAGHVSPDGMQRLLNFSPWDEDAARDALAASWRGGWAIPPRSWCRTRRGSSRRAG